MIRRNLDEIMRKKFGKNPEMLSYMETYILMKIIKSVPSPQYSGEVTLTYEEHFDEGLLEVLRALKSKGFIELSDFTGSPLIKAKALELCRDLEDLNKELLDGRLSDLEYAIEFHKIFSLMKENPLIAKIYPIKYLKPLTFMFNEIQPVIALNFDVMLAKIPDAKRREYISRSHLKFFDKQHYLKILKEYLRYCARRALTLMKIGLFNDRLDEVFIDYLNYISFLLPFFKPYTDWATYSIIGSQDSQIEGFIVPQSKIHSPDLIFVKELSIMETQQPPVEVVQRIGPISLSKILNSAVVVMLIFSKLWHVKDHKLSGLLERYTRGGEFASSKGP